MKAILMAAGVGSRISSQTNKPKSLLPLRNDSLLKHSVKLLQANNIEVFIVLGYKSEYIKRELQGMNVTFLENPFFLVTNSIASLWFARHLLNEDVLLFNADVFYTQEILDCILSTKEDVVMLADSSRVLEGDYFFRCENNKLVDFGKELKLKERTCEYVGIALIREVFIIEFKNQLELLVNNGEYNFWWENTLYSLISQREIYVKDVNGLFWGEVDTKDEYRRILDFVKKTDIKEVW